MPALTTHRLTPFTCLHAVMLIAWSAAVVSGDDCVNCCGDAGDSAVMCSDAGDGCCDLISACGGASCCGCRCYCCDDQPWQLIPDDPCSPYKFGGWLNGGIMFNFNDNRTSRNDPVAFSNPAAEFQGNQAWMFFEREADNNGCGWAWGARIDAIYGTDGPDTQAFGDSGWDFGWNSGGEYGSAIPQIYAEVLYNDLSLKVGHFYTIMGYEVVQAPNNFFYSHAYTMNYGEPFTHTGALAEYTTQNGTTLWGGYTFGWDSGFDNRFDAHTFLGGFSKQLNEDVTVTYTVNAGRYGNGTGASGNLGDIFLHSFVLDVRLTDRLNYVLLHDLAHNEIPGSSPVGFGGAMNDNASEWYGITQYLFYTVNECWKVGMRFEWFDDADGLRIATVNDGLNDLHYFGATLGLNWTPTANLIFRPEVRFDWATSHSDNDFNDVFLNNTKSHIGLAGFDMIWVF